MGIKFSIPGDREYAIKNVVFDLNGTIANRGKIKESTERLVLQLAKEVDVFVVTADTHSSASKLRDIFGESVILTVLSGTNTAIEKENLVSRLGAGSTVAIGNGFNDVKMLKVASLSVAVLGDEGCSSKALWASDIAVKDIDHIIEMLLNTDRIIATLRG